MRVLDLDLNCGRLARNMDGVKDITHGHNRLAISKEGGSDIHLPTSPCSATATGQARMIILWYLMDEDTPSFMVSWLYMFYMRISTVPTPGVDNDISGSHE